MRPFYLHIGTHKTGTTSFQAWLVETAAKRSAHGTTVLVEKAPRGKVRGNAIGLANSVLRPSLNTAARMSGYIARPGFRQRFATLAKLHQLCARRGAKRFVASAESLCFAREPKEMTRLQWFFRVAQVEVIPVVCFRNEADWRESWGRELARWDGRFHGDFGAGTDDIRGDWVFDRDAILAFWEQIGPVRTVDYDAELERRGTVLPALAQAMDLIADDGTGRVFLNRSA